MVKNNYRIHQANNLFEENIRVPEVIHTADGDKSYKLNKDLTSFGKVDIAKGTVVTGTITNGVLTYQGRNIPSDYLDEVTSSNPLGWLNDIFGTVNKAADTVTHVKDTLTNIKGTDSSNNNTPSNYTASNYTASKGITPLGWAGIAVGGILLIGGIIWAVSKKKK